jgi:hypothetical protein
MKTISARPLIIINIMGISTTNIYRLLLIFIYFVFPTLVLAQRAHAKKIILITNTNDTLQGTIAYPHKFKFYKKILIKDKNNIQKVIDSKNVKSFTIQEEDKTVYYKTLFIEADYSETNISRLSDTPDVELVKDTVFAQLLFQGVKNLYVYMDNFVFKEHFLIETSEGVGVDLINKEYYTDDSRRLIAYNSLYKKQLMQVLSSSTIPISLLNTIPFTKQDILNLLKDYSNNISPNTITYEYKEEKCHINFGITAGMNVTHLKFHGRTELYNSFKFDPSISWNAGLILNVVLPNTQKKWSIYNELLFSNYTIKSTNNYIYYAYYENDNWYKSTNSFFVKASYLKLFSAAHYQFRNRFAPFIQMGIANGYALNNSSLIRYETKFYSAALTEEEQLVRFRKFEQSLFAGFGLHYKKIGLELRYEIGNGFSKSRLAKSVMNYGYVLGSYMF